MGLPGGRGSPIERRDRGQAACPTRALRPARRAASTANPPASTRAAARTPSEGRSQPGCPLGAAGGTGALVGWRQASPTWASVGGCRVLSATVGCSAATWGWRQASPTWPSVGGWRASWLLVGWSLAWAWARVVMAARFMAARVAPRTRARASLDMVASDRSTGALRVTGWLVGGDGWPPGQLPPAAARPGPAPAARWASTRHQSCVGGLLVPLGDALLGQRLAQPGMLVVHVSFPSCSSAASPAIRPRIRCRWPTQNGPAACRRNPVRGLRRNAPLPLQGMLSPITHVD